MPDRIAYIGGILAGLAALVKVLFDYFKYKGMGKQPSDTAHAQSTMKSNEIFRVINRLLASVSSSKIISIAIVENGGHLGDPALPKKFTVRYSTDFNTWEMFNEPSQMEQDLLLIHERMINFGFCEFKASQLKRESTKRWYEANEMTQSSAHLIGIDESKGWSYVLYINYTAEHIVSPQVHRLIELSVKDLAKLFEPSGWLRKKNYIIS